MEKFPLLCKLNKSSIKSVYVDEFADIENYIPSKIQLLGEISTNTMEIPDEHVCFKDSSIEQVFFEF